MFNLFKKSKYDPHKYWTKRGKTYKNKFVYTDGFKQQENIVINELSKLTFNSVIEFGCGFGRFTKLINEKYTPITFEAFDLSIEQVNNTKKICENVDLKQSTIQTFEPKQKADLVFGSEVLMHVPPNDIVKCIENITSWSTKYIVIVDASNTKQSLESHNFVHDYNNLLKKYGDITEIKIGLQSVFICRK